MANCGWLPTDTDLGSDSAMHCCVTKSWSLPPKQHKRKGKEFQKKRKTEWERLGFTTNRTESPTQHRWVFKRKKMVCICYRAYRHGNLNKKGKQWHKRRQTASERQDLRLIDWRISSIPADVEKKNWYTYYHMTCFLINSKQVNCFLFFLYSSRKKCFIDYQQMF